MIKKIISGGQTGADQAALDTAIKWNISHGGWVPRGRLTEAGRLPDKYDMQEMPTSSYSARTEQNVIDSEGTLIISHGPLTDGSKHTKEMAIKHEKPFIHINLNNEADSSRAAEHAHEWITKSKIEMLNVAGPRSSNDPSIYQAVMHILTIIIVMDFIEIKTSPSQTKLPLRPLSLDKAVNMISSRMSLRERCYIANMVKAELIYLDITLGDYIRKTFGMNSGHEDLLQECREILGRNDITDNDAVNVIITELWKRLRETHAMRIVK
ncbi:MAG: putative molybdenum carrier protein [Deltaproteobacteria bacterium]|nr:putative molybdenum carrier protein [Deltaproteobacteria bacterium]